MSCDPGPEITCQHGWHSRTLSRDELVSKYGEALADRYADTVFATEPCPDYQHNRARYKKDRAQRNALA